MPMDLPERKRAPDERWALRFFVSAAIVGVLAFAIGMGLLSRRSDQQLRALVTRAEAARDRDRLDAWRSVGAAAQLRGERALQRRALDEICSLNPPECVR